ncbi:hypothetical protein GCM10022221_68580 [Actinocorallia aurea]
MFDSSINPNAVAARAGVLAFLTRGAQAAREAENLLAHRSMLPDGRVPAVVAGRVVGRFNMPRESVTAEVHDWGKLLKWAEDNRPDMVETVEVRRLHKMSLHWLLDDCKAKGAPVSDTGETIPGITVHQTGNSPTMTLADDVDEVVSAALADPQAQPAMLQALTDALRDVLGLPGLELHLPEGIPDE